MTDRKTAVLLVEDNAADARLIKELLKEAASGSFRVKCADSLANGLACLNAGSFDVVVLDLSLPDSDGMATFRAVRAHAPQAPVIVLTGHDDDLLATVAMRAGAQDYIVKGRMNGDALARSIRYAIERKRVADALKENAQFTAMLLQTTPLGMDIVDEEGRLLFISPSLQALLGRETLGETCWQLYKDNGQQCADCPLKQPIEPGMTKVTETTGVLGEREFEISHTGMIYQGKKALLEVFHDITERKRAERLSRLANQVLDLLNRPVGESDTIHDLLALVRESTGLSAVGIRLREGEDYPYELTTGFPDHFLATERSLCARDKTGALLRDGEGRALLECWCGAVLSGRTDPVLPFFTELGSFWTNSTTTLLASTTETERFFRTRNRCNREGYESVALIPLRSGSEVIGLLQLNDRRSNRFNAEMIQFFEGLGSSIGIALSRKRAAEALRESESSLQGILSSTADGILAVSAANKVLFANERFAKMWMIPPEVMTNDDDAVLLNAILDQLIDPQRFLQKIQELYKSNEESFDTLYFKDGRVFERLSRPLMQEEKSLGRVWSFRDITARTRTEEALRGSDDRYRDLVEHSHDLICTHDLEGVILSANPAATRITGYPKNELVGMNLQDCLVPEYRDQFAGYLAEIKAKGNASGFMVVQTKGGERRIWEYDNTLRTEGVSTPVVRGMARDITERRRAQAALQESESRLRTIVEGTQALLASVDAHGHFTYMNDATARALGYESPEELMGKSCLHFIHPEDRKQLLEAFVNQISARQRSSMHESRIVDVAGNVKWFSLLTTLAMKGDQVIGQSGVAQDITERKQAEIAVRESEERFRSILDNIADGYFEVDTAGNFTFFNPALVRMLGRPANELMGMNNRQYMTPEGGKAVFQTFNRIFRTGIPEQSVDWRLVRPDGALQSVEASVSLIKAADGSIKGFRGTVRDITERKRAEEALQRAEERYRALFNEAPAMYIITRDVEGAPVIADCNELACSTLGFSHDELVGRPLADFYSPASRVRMLEGGGYRRALAGEDVTEERELVTRDGRIVPSVVRAVAEVDAKGYTSGTRAMYVDITERKRAEEALRQRVAELEALQRVSTALRSTGSLQEMLDMLLDETLAVTGAESGGIWLYDAVSNELRPSAVRGWFVRIGDRALSSSEGISGETFLGGQMIVSREFKSDPRTNASAREQSPEGWGGACVPLQTADQVLGLLFCSVELPRELGIRELGLLLTLAEMGGTAIHRKSLHDQTERQLAEAEALRQVERAVASNFDLKVTLGLAVKRAGDLLGADAATVMLSNAYELKYAAWDGIRSQLVGKTRMRISGSCAGRAITERQMIAVDHLAEQTAAGALPRFYLDEGFTVYHAMPIIAKGVVKGVLEVLHRASFATTPHWLDLLTALAGQAAMAIDNADLFEGLQRSNAELTLAYDATIEGWSRALDLRDKETEGHSRRVTELTVRLASLMGVTDADLVHVRRGALLHDIGKLGVPDQILLKPGELTSDEWNIMRQHPKMAVDLLSSIPYLRPALDIPASHHEKWDGTGYPQGLRGTDIPLAARLFAIADVADALGSDRPYRPAWPAAKIQEYLREQSGRHFDPQVVAMFLAMDMD